MTLKETVIVLVVVGILAVVVISYPRKARSGNSRNSCRSNLRQVSLGIRLWAADHNERFVWEVSTNQGGTLGRAGSTNLWQHWYAMRREIESPRVLTCPVDSGRPPIRLFTNQTDARTSYALNLSASLLETNSILLLDRNIVRDRSRLSAGWQSISTNSRLAWDSDLHRNRGNIAFADGRGFMGDSEFLQSSFRNSPAVTNRLLIP